MWHEGRAGEGHPERGELAASGQGYTSRAGTSRVGEGLDDRIAGLVVFAPLDLEIRRNQGRSCSDADRRRSHRDTVQGRGRAPRVGACAFEYR